MHSIKAELKHLKSGGSIVNAASVAGLIGMEHATAYVASKVRIEGFKTFCCVIREGPC